MELLLKYFPQLNDTQLEKFSRLQELYTHWNAQINVISRKDMEHFYERHVLHSLAITKQFHFTEGTKLLDIGTGGGFPSIPLAIFFPEVHITACDSIGKKIKVVTEVAQALQLHNIHPHAGRVEQVNGRFDFIVSRAVAPLSDLYKWTQHQVAAKGRNKMANGWICLKGGDLKDEIAEVKKLNKTLHVEQWNLSDFYKEEFFETKKLLYVY
jgi:16S rRNA (guanine527-N7)-methyltransferase